MSEATIQRAVARANAIGQDNMLRIAGTSLMLSSPPATCQRLIDSLPCPSKSSPPATRKRKTSTSGERTSGVSVDKSCRTDRRSVAKAILKRIEGEIERGEYQQQKSSAPTFISAAVAYMEAGRRKRYVARLISHFGETPLDEIDQAAIDTAAVALHPNACPATRNACVYTPVAAILHHAGADIKIKRPKGAKGRVVADSAIARGCPIR